MVNHRWVRAAIICCLLALGWGCAPAQGIQFQQGSFEEAQAQAAKSGKMLMMVVLADWMEVCEIMEKDIFTEPEIGAAFNPYFVAWRLDAKLIEGSPFYGGVRILSLPEFIFFDSKGNPQYREKKLHDHDEMLAMALAARNPKNHLKTRDEKYKSGYREPGFVRQYIVDMDAAGHDMQVPSREYLKKIPREQLLETDNWIIALIGVQGIKDPKFQYVIGNKAAFVNQFGEESVNGFILGAYRNSLQAACDAQNPTLLADCKRVVQQLLGAAAREVILQDELSYHAAGKNWAAYQKTALELFSTYQGEDAVLYNEVAWAFCLHIQDPQMWVKAATWAQKSVALQPESWNYHTLGSLQLKNGDREAAAASAQKAMELADPGSDAAKEAQNLIDQIKNSR